MNNIQPLTQNERSFLTAEGKDSPTYKPIQNKDHLHSRHYKNMKSLSFTVDLCCLFMKFKCQQCCVGIFAMEDRTSVL